MTNYKMNITLLDIKKQYFKGTISNWQGKNFTTKLKQRINSASVVSYIIGNNNQKPNITTTQSKIFVQLKFVSTNITRQSQQTWFWHLNNLTYRAITKYVTNVLGSFSRLFMMLE